MRAMHGFLAATFFLALVSDAMAHPEKLLTRLDADGDGAVSRAEFDERTPRASPRLLHRADADGDGQVTRDELRAGLETATQQRQQQFTSRMLALFDEIDGGGDGNGVVTRGEIRAHAFARLDANGDGYVTEEEADAVRGRRPPLAHRRQGPPGPPPSGA